MKIYVWEGHGISSAYHDDGTLVVLANSPEEAREITRIHKIAMEQRRKFWYQERDALTGGKWVASNDPEMDALEDRYPDEQAWDGSDEALDREPDRVIDLDVPAMVVFNGGGYD